MKSRFLNMSRLLAFCAATCTMAVSMPPTAMMTNTGVRMRAKIIRVACTVSVQLTARKPPKKV